MHMATSHGFFEAAGQPLLLIAAAPLVGAAFLMHTTWRPSACEGHELIQCAVFCGFPNSMLVTAVNVRLFCLRKLPLSCLIVQDVCTLMACALPGTYGL